MIVGRAVLIALVLSSPAMALDRVPSRANELGAPLLQYYDLQEDVDTFTPAAELHTLADGRLLAVTIGSIAVFDGVRWIDARHPRGLTGAMRAAIAADGRIFVGFDGDTGYFQETARGRFEWHSLAHRLPPDALNLGVVCGVFVSGRTQLIVARAGALRLHDDGRTEWWAAGTGNGTPWLSAIQVGDELWLRAADGTGYRQSIDAVWQPRRFEALHALTRAAAGSAVPVVRRVVADGDDDWRVLLADARLYRWHRGQFEPWAAAATRQLRDRQPVTMERLRNGHFLIAGVAHGPLLLDAQGQVLREFGEADGIPQRVTYDILEDRQGGAWLAQALGVLRLDLGTGVTRFEDAQGLPGGGRAFLRWQGELFVVGGSGLFRLLPGDAASAARFERVLPKTLTTVSNIAAAGSHLLVSRNGLDRIARDGQGWRHTKLIALSQSNDLVESTLQRGRYWLAHAQGVDEIELDPDGEMLGHRRLPGVDWPVLRVEEDPKGGLWLADRGGRLWHWRGADDIRTFGREQGVPPSTVFPYAGKRHGWFATLEGVMVAADDGKRLVSPEWLPPPLRSTRMFSLYEDPARNLWVRGDAASGVAWWRDGRYRFDPQVLGAVSMRSTIHAFWREDDIVWIARARDVLRLDLAARHDMPRAAAPLISQVMVNGEVVDPSGLVGLPPSARDLSVSFGSADLHRAEALEFRARLVGFETGYSPWRRDAQRVYTNLPDGSFSLEVESRDGYGRIATAPPLPIQVSAPWYRTPAAYVAAALFALLALRAASDLGARRRQSVMAARQRELEQEVERRTCEIASQSEQLREQAERLTTLDRLKTNFFVNIGHEFRTPLTLVLGPLDDVLRDARTRLGERTREQLEMASRNARRVLDLIVELLDVNRLEHGEMPLRRESSDFAAWLRSTLPDLEALVSRHGHRLQVEIVDMPLPCDFDPQQMERVLSNLVGNAAKYMTRGGVVDIGLGVDADFLLLQVRDRGCGIAAADLPHIFDRFHRVDERRGQGHGIGLALSREIVQRHGGGIEAESVPGNGSTMKLRLPLLSSATESRQPMPVRADAGDRQGPTQVASAAPMPPGQKESMDPGDRRERPRVLVVDDHPDMRLRVQQLLASRFEVLGAGDGPEALQLAVEHLPDVIVADVMMPGFDGVELTRRLRAQGETRAIGVILLTAKSGAEHAVRGLEAGANDYLSKPFDAAELLARVSAILAHARRLQLQLAAAAPALPLPPRASRDERWMQRIEQHIDARLHDSEFDVETLAAAMHMDRSGLFRRLKLHTAQGPAELLRERRLLRAQTLLREGAGSVTEVAFAVGFDTLSGFTRAFRARFGNSPSSQLPRGADRA